MNVVSAIVVSEWVSGIELIAVVCCTAQASTSFTESFTASQLNKRIRKTNDDNGNNNKNMTGKTRMLVVCHNNNNNNNNSRNE